MTFFFSFSSYSPTPRTLLWFFSKDPVMDILPLLLEGHGSEVIFNWPRKFEEGSMKRGNRWFGLNILSCKILIMP